jgi:hypothetical protein
MMPMLATRIAVVAVTLFASTVSAQEPAQATLTVLVTDVAGAKVAGAHLVASNEATGARLDGWTQLQIQPERP